MRLSFSYWLYIFWIQLRCWLMCHRYHFPLHGLSFSFFGGISCWTEVLNFNVFKCIHLLFTPRSWLESPILPFFKAFMDLFFTFRSLRCLKLTFVFHWPVCPSLCQFRVFITVAVYTAAVQVITSSRLVLFQFDKYLLNTSCGPGNILGTSIEESIKISVFKRRAGVVRVNK